MALSSTEAEYMAASQAAKEALFLINVLTELEEDVQTPVTLNCDNVGAIELSKNQGYHPRTKHIDIRHHFLRELVEDQRIQLRHVSTKDMLADILTKALGRLIHQRIAEIIN